MKLSTFSTRMAVAFALCLALPMVSTARETTSSARVTTASVAGADAATSNVAVVPAPRGGKSAEMFQQRHESFIARGKEGPIGVLFMGDSITQGWEKVPEIWKTAFGEWQPANFGIGGDRTEHVLWRIDNGELDGIKPKVMVLMIGTNNSNSNSAEEIAAGVELILEKTKAKLPETKVLLLAVFPREARKDQPENPQMQVIEKLNPMLAKMHDGERVFFKDIGEVFKKDGSVPKEIMPDGLHLTKEGYQLWADAVKPEIEKLMK